MTIGVISNPASANVPPGGLYFPRILTFVALDPNITQTTINALVAATLPATGPLSVALPGGIGAGVTMQSWNGIISGAAQTLGVTGYPTVAITTTTASTSFFGVIHGAQTGAGKITMTGAANAPNVVEIGLQGIFPVLVDANTTTVGHTLNQSTSKAGTFTDSSGTTWTAGQTMGVCAQALTASGSAIGQVYAFVKGSA